MFDLPHRRFNPLTGQWLLVSPQRTERPWQGAVESSTRCSPPPFDPDCYLCPGVERAGGPRTPHYDAAYVFDNDYPAMLPDTPHADFDDKGLTVARSEAGLCRVICYSPRHDLSLGQLPTPEVVRVVDTWAEQYRTLGELDWVQHVQIFENRGSMMGASNPHPHGQIWAQQTIPADVAVESQMQLAYARGGSCLLCDYAELELAKNERVIFADENVVVLVPFWATWPYETLLLTRRHAASLADAHSEDRDATGAALQSLIRCYDELFHVAFPYSAGWHQAPTDGVAHPEWHVHAHFYPPLLRSATVRKFMVGYELLAQPQRDLTPEVAAAVLRAAVA